MSGIGPAELVDVSACMNYVIGVLDGYAIGVISSGKERTMACNIPNEASTKEMALIVQHYIRDHPEALHRPASVITLKALDNAFPCKAESQGGNQ